MIWKVSHRKHGVINRQYAASQLWLAEQYSGDLEGWGTISCLAYKLSGSTGWEAFASPKRLLGEQVCYADIKPANLLLKYRYPDVDPSRGGCSDAPPSIRVIDFGCSQMVQEGSKLAKRTGGSLSPPERGLGALVQGRLRQVCSASCHGLPEVTLPACPRVYLISRHGVPSQQSSRWNGMILPP